MAGNADAKGMLFQASLARELVDQVAADSAAPPVLGEADYYKLMNKKFRQMAELVKLAPPSGMPREQAANFNALHATFVASYNYWSGINAGGTLDSPDPNRFAGALTALQAAVAATDNVINILRDNTNTTIAEMTARKPGKPRSKDAIALTNALPPAVLQALAPEKQVELLKALRQDFADKKGKKAYPADFEPALKKIYQATRLDDSFVDAQDALQPAVIAELMKHKKELQQARDEWPLMNEADRLKVFDKIIAAHCKTMGFGPPTALSFVDKPRTNGGTYQTGSKDIVLNRNGHAADDFEAMMDTMFHENSHNWQFQLIERLRGNLPPPLAPDDPAYKQALMFEANSLEYFSTKEIDEGDAYGKQPLEAHAFRAGAGMARALLRALNT